VFVVLSIVIGPGLLGSVVLKDHWEHPRPRDIVEFGGPLQYLPSPLVGHGGASFPCGHCTIGFLYGSGWWIWRRRRPAWARLSLGTGLALGGVLGAGRLAAGGHFVSDILWSALLAFGVCHVVYHHVLRTPAVVPREPPATYRDQEGRWQNATAAVAVVRAAGVLAALFANPHGVPLAARISRPSARRTLEVDAPRGNIRVVLVDAPTGELVIQGALHGFGPPTSRLGAHVELVRNPLVTLRYRIEQRGWFTDLDGLQRCACRLRPCRLSL
jgi:hypothetical protein